MRLAFVTFIRYNFFNARRYGFIFDFHSVSSNLAQSTLWLALYLIAYLRAYNNTNNHMCGIDSDWADEIANAFTTKVGPRLLFALFILSYFADVCGLQTAGGIGAEQI